MGDAIVSVVAERITAIIEEEKRNEVNLVLGVKNEILYKEIHHLSVELETIRAVLDDAESQRFTDETVKDWFKRLEDASYEMDNVLDEWNFAILKHKMEQEYNKQKVCFLIPSSCLCLKKEVVHHDIAMKIKYVKGQLDQILKERDQFNFVMSQPTTDHLAESWRGQSTSFIDLAEVHGRDRDRDDVMRKLMFNSDSYILSIVGVGGLGKTTLAQLVYNDGRVEEYFELKTWICVSDPFDVVRITKGIIESVRNGGCPDTNQLEILLQYLGDSISGKKFLLVLDDVWTEDYAKWEPLKNSFKCGGVGSKILVTTRNERVARMMGTRDSAIYRLGLLSEEDCWLVLRRMALFGRNEAELEIFEDISVQIAKRCKGLPLVAKVLGSFLRFKNSLEEWKNVLYSEIWQLENEEVDLFPHLFLSYNELSPALKRCFSYCAVFPKDSEIEVDNLIGNWMALGYLGSNSESGRDMELKGREYFQILAMLSLFQDFETDDLDGKIKGCKMHDIVLDFARSLRKDISNGRAEAAIKKTTCQSCSPLLVFHVEKYFSLFWDKYCPPNLCDCLTSLRVLGITRCNLHNIPRGMDNLIHLRWLDLSYNEFSRGDLKTICMLYNLQFLRLKRCELQEIPMEIGNLIHLIHLNLSYNKSVKKLPESMCGLHELQTLNVDGCSNLCELPEGIHSLINLKHLHNRDTSSLKQFPQGLAQLTALRTLTEFRGGNGWSKLGWLKNLNCLQGSLTLWIRLTDDFKDAVEDAREAELRTKIHIQNLELIFFDYMVEKESISVRMDVIDALMPHPNLRNLEIWNCGGFKLPGWITSPLNQIRYIKLHGFNHTWSLPPLGKLPYLEEILMYDMYGLQFVGRELLGIRTAARDSEIESSSSSSFSNTIGFPRLKKLTFRNCPKWKEWEDITEEEYFAAVALMPCLTELTIQFCKGLRALPHHLLRQAFCLEVLDISRSAQLQQRYGDKDGSDWKSISENNTSLQLKLL